MHSEGPPEPVLVVLQKERGTLRVIGPEARAWLNGLVTCDVLPVAEGRGAFGLSLNKQGKIQSEIEIVARRRAANTAEPISIRNLPGGWRSPSGSDAS